MIYTTRMIQCNHDRILEREEDTLLPQTEQKNNRGIQSELEGWKKGRQERLHISSSKGSPLCGQASRLCKRASAGYGKKDWEIPFAQRSCTPYEWDKIRQSNRKSNPIKEYFGTRLVREGARYL